MTTEMKQLLALLLLLGCAFTVRGEGEPDMDPCTSGLAAIRLYNQYRGCSGPDPDDYVEDLMSSIANNMTVDNLITIVSNYCSNVFPKLAPCFQQNIENCTTDEQNSMMSIAGYTGFACERNTNRTHPVIQYVFSRLTSADLAVNDQCNQQLHTAGVCHNRSLEAIGVSYANFSQVIPTLTLEDLAPKIQTYMKTSMNCTVTHIRDNLENCTAWRGRALYFIKFQLLPTLLSNNMTFTTADMDDLFDWPVQFAG